MADFADAIPVLIQAGADLEVTDLSGHTPLYGAVVNGKLASVEALLSAGANLTGETAVFRYLNSGRCTQA